MSGYRYWELKGDPEGRRFCYGTEPLFVCPFGRFERERVDGEVTRRLPGKAEAYVVAISGVMGTTAEDVMRLLERGHSGVGHHRRRVDGKLTDRCDGCGAKMIDHGFTAWVERDRTDDSAASRVAERMGMRGPSERLKVQPNLKRREARQWAYDEYMIARGALDEAKARAER